MRNLLFVLLFSVAAFGQGVRYDTFPWTVGAGVPSGGGGGSGGSPITVNGSLVTNPNFNAGTPGPVSGANVTWQFLGSNVSGYIGAATSSTFGVVKPDNSSITISNGIISATGGTIPSGTQGQMFGYGPSNVPAPAQLAHWSGSLLGILADGSSDDCSLFNTAAGIVSTAGGGYLDLPVRNLTWLKTCDPDIPANVIVFGTVTPGWIIAPLAAPKSGLRVSNSGSTSNPIISCIHGGFCGGENLYVQNDTNRPTWLMTASVPWLVNVTVRGEKSAQGSPTCGAAVLAAIRRGCGLVFRSRSAGCGIPALPAGAVTALRTSMRSTSRTSVGGFYSPTTPTSSTFTA